MSREAGAQCDIIADVTLPPWARELSYPAWVDVEITPDLWDQRLFASDVV